MESDIEEDFFFLFCFANLLMIELHHWKCLILLTIFYSRIKWTGRNETESALTEHSQGLEGNAGLQALPRKKSPHVTWTQCTRVYPKVSELSR